jgi:DNA-binding transcriptional regulator YiaG
MSVSTESPVKSRPFPWRCYRCGQTEVRPAMIAYTARVKHDGEIHTLEIPALVVPRCGACGELTFDGKADDQINDALRTHLRLMTKEQIRLCRAKVSLSPHELAHCLGVPEQTVLDWEDGLSIQSHAMDKRLRVLFTIPEDRAVLPGRQPESHSGALVG